jgi:flagellin
MSQVINTNVPSLNAQRNLSTSGTALSQSLTRLSSGLRINSAKDDAAGLAISDRFTTQIRGLNQAVRNANDGISLSQTAEGALAEITSNLQRVRELAVQSANATNSASDRAALNQEVQQRIAEIDRVSSQTSFNSRKILDGSFGNATFQVGANVGQTISLDLNTSTRTSEIGGKAEATTTAVDALFDAGDGVDVVANVSASSGGFTTGVSDTDGQNFTFVVDGVEILNVTQTGGVAETITAADVDAAVDAAEAALAEIGITASGSAAGGDLVFTKADGSAFDIALTSDFAPPGGFANVTFNDTQDNGTEAVAATPVPLALEAGDFTIQVGDGDVTSIVGTFDTAAELAEAINSQTNGTYATINDAGELVLSAAETITIASANQDLLDEFGAAGEATFAIVTEGNLNDVDVLTTAGANDAIQRVDAALQSVSTLRSTFGAVQNRFESTITNLQTTSENLAASRSRILDADFAQETANLTRAQILQQAGVAILAQANQLPQNVLSLLR